MAQRIWLGVHNGFYAGLAGLQRGTAYECSDDLYKACPDYWGEIAKPKEEKEVTKND